MFVLTDLIVYLQRIATTAMDAMLSFSALKRNEHTTVKEIKMKIKLAIFIKSAIKCSILKLETWHKLITPFDYGLKNKV